MADEAAIETVHIYPYGEENAVLFKYEPKESDNILIDNDSVRVIVTDEVNDSIWGTGFKIYLENKTDTSIMFSVNDASLNGYMVDPFFAHSVEAHKCAFSSLTWSDSNLKENDITEIEEAEFTLRAYANEDWSLGDFANEKIVIK